MAAKVSGCAPGERRLNGPQTTGREYRFRSGHRIRLLIVSDDQPHDVPTMMGFWRPPVTPAVRVRVQSSSRLLLPVIPVVP